MPEGNFNQEFRLQKTDEIRNYSIEKICTTLDYVDHLLIVISTIT